MQEIFLPVAQRPNQPASALYAQEMQKLEASGLGWCGLRSHEAPPGLLTLVYALQGPSHQEKGLSAEPAATGPMSRGAFCPELGVSQAQKCPFLARSPLGSLSGSTFPGTWLPCLSGPSGENRTWWVPGEEEWGEVLNTEGMVGSEKH